MPITHQTQNLGEVTMHKNIKVLIVDDASMIRTLVKRGLAEMGVEKFDEAGDGIEAYQKLVQAATDNVPFDIIFLDWNMPNMSGIDLVVKVKSHSKLKDVPIVMVTSERDHKAIIEALKYGVRDYIVKPFSNHTLSEKVRILLQGKKAS